MPDRRPARPFRSEEAVKRFVVEVLEVRTSASDCPAVLNLEVEFAGFLRTSMDFDELEAGELASVHQRLVRHKVGEQITRWSGQGVRAPFALALDSDGIVVSWRHERFEEVSGLEPPDAAMMSIYAWLERQRDRAFLLPCLCFLKTLDCDPIFVTDGPFDEGIDCLGLIASGPLRSTAVFVQAKSSIDFLHGDVLMREHGKYAGLPRTEKYGQYLSALRISALRDGAAYVYAALLNSDTQHSAQQAAYKLGVLLRSRRQLAQALAARYSAASLEELKARFALSPTADLTTNVASRL